MQIDLPADLPDDVCTEIAKRVCYCDEDINGSYFDKDNMQIVLKLAQSNDTESIKRKVDVLINKMKTERLAVQSKEIKRHSSQRGYFDPDVLATLNTQELVHPEGVGVIARSGAFLQLVRKLDQLLERIAVDVFSAQVRDFNSLIPSDWLQKANYFTAFPHSVTFATHLREDYDIIENFCARHQQGESLNFESIDEFTQSEYCLSPAICYHAYGNLSNKVFSENDDGLKVVTASGRCFRYESKNITKLDRLWEFTMREIIFIGEKDKVLASRSKAIDYFWQIIELLDINARIVTASDPFFATDFSALRYFQMTNDLKYEILLPISEEKEIACGSYNFHDNVLGNSFHIHLDSEQKAFTGCAAFGLERFVYGILTQMPLEEAISKLDEFGKSLPG